MNQTKVNQFKKLYQRHLKLFKLQGKSQNIYHSFSVIVAQPLSFTIWKKINHNALETIRLLWTPSATLFLRRMDCGRFTERMNIERSTSNFE